MPQANDLSRCLTAVDQDSTLIAVIEMSQSSWRVAGIVPGIERHPAKKLEPDPTALLRRLQPHGTSPWAKGSRRAEAERSGRKINRIAVGFEAGRDGVWLARWLRARDVKAQVIDPPQQHRGLARASPGKTDRLDGALLKRAFLGWLRGERDPCQMIAIPSLEEEDARRPGRERDALVNERTRIINRIKRTLAGLGIRGFKPNLRNAAARLETLRTPAGVPLPGNTLAELRRERTRLQLIGGQIREIETTRVQQLEPRPSAGAHPMVRLLAPVRGVGVETADMLVNQAFLRPLRDQRAVARGACPGEGRGRSDRRAGRKRPPPTGNGLGSGRQCSGAAWGDPVGVAVSDGPKGQPLGAMILVSDRRSSRRHPQNHDRGAGPQAAHRPLFRPGAGLWRRATTGEVPEGVVLRPVS